ncbi:MAG: DNA-binding protein WhiA [Mycoplasmataceae bacterium]|nr:DNA-binding protein WhiA [Mycoplasmataceae bacterium]
MEIKKSFSEFIKNEILKYDWSKKEWLILFHSFLISNGTLVKDKFSVSTTLFQWEKKFIEFFNEFWKIEVCVKRTKNLIKFEVSDKEFINKIMSKSEMPILNHIEKSKAYLAGVFIGKGWINLPSSRFYHCEMRVKNITESLDLQEVLDSLGIKSATISKKGWYLTYIKKSIDISNFIKAVNASESVMIFEDSRIERDFVATYKKMESIEKYNYEKSHKVSVKHIESINKILGTIFFESLDENKKILAKLRLEKPNYSLSELQMEFNYRNNKNFSKSTISNWLNLIVELSNFRK